MSVKRKIIPYNPELKVLAKELRRNMTLSEVLLWNELKNKQVAGFDFDRQRPIGDFVVDFYCKELSLAIEIDGDTHTYRYDHDYERQRELEKLGVRFLRFDDIEVKRNMNNVLRVIEDWIGRNRCLTGDSKEINKTKKPTPSLPQSGGNYEEETLLNHQERGENFEEKPTPSPSKEGNLKKEHTTNLPQSGGDKSFEP